MSDQVANIVQAAFVLIASVVGSWLLYKGAQKTAAASRAGAQHVAASEERAEVMQAWKDLTAPLQAEVTRLHQRLTDVETKRAEEQRAMQAQITTLTERVDFLQVQLQHWKRLARVIARWATTLRDQVLSLGGTVPATPDELLLIQSLDDDDL